MQINKACSRPSIQHQPIWDSELQRDIVTFHAGAIFLALSCILCFTTMQQKHSLRKVCIYASLTKYFKTVFYLAFLRVIFLLGKESRDT